MNNLSNVLLGNEDRSLLAIIPSEQLVNQSLHIVASQKQYKEWSDKDHVESYSFMQRIAHAWTSGNLTSQYLIYGKIDSNIFKWEIVPYQSCRNFISRIIQQLKVLWRIVFGGFVVSQEVRQKQLKDHQLLLEKFPETIQASASSNIGDDSFCKNETIERQWVITGKKVNVLFNYAPVGFGGERLHFLVVPKEHRETFTDVTQEEYSESIALTTKLVNHFTETRKTIKSVYLLNKTGIDTGQTIKHWLLHVIFTTNTAQDFWGKITVMKNIVFGSSPMKKEEVAKKVISLREELAQLQAPL